MSDPNIFVSNGTCYTAPGKKLDGSFIPCGNDAFGHQTCCGAGDNCLADNACFGIHSSGYGSYLTYWAGCTDPDYKDPSCPKKQIDQPWVALTLCDNSNGEWAICSQEGNPSTLRPGSYCSCTVASSATVAFSDSNSLANIASLPQSTGQSIQFVAGHYPTSSPAAASASPTQDSSAAASSATQTQSSSLVSGSAAQTQSSGTSSAHDNLSSAASSATATSGPTSSGAGSTHTDSGSVTVLTSNGKTVTSFITPSTISSPSSTNAGNSGPTSSGRSTTPSGSGTNSALSLGAKAGIGVGAAVGGLLLIAIILALLLLRRRRETRLPPEIESGDSDKSANPPEPDPSKEKPVSAAPTAPMAVEADSQARTETDGRAAPPWRLRSELEGSKVASNLAGHAEGGAAADGTHSRPVAELPGSEHFARERRPGSTMAQTLAEEAHRQLGPAWRGHLWSDGTRDV